jgi:hypothetical protein
LENSLGQLRCFVCGTPLVVTPYPKGGGFRLDCFGTDAEPHRGRFYLDKFRKDASFVPGLVKLATVETFPGPQAPPEETPRISRAKELLARAERLAAAA